ncbi:MAG: HAD hydrolase-like protein [Dorea sp.]|nr:HAD hydrolase-like protein [Dorea sp.]
MDQETFVKYYFPLLAKRMMKYGIEPKATINAVWQGVAAMTSHDGEQTNEAAFWECFEGLLGVKREDVEDEIIDFYGNEFNQAIAATQPTKTSNEIIKTLKNQGKKVYLATNPIFPSVATMNRIRWAGLEAGDFEYITVYENSYSSKPNVKYYRDLMERFDLNPEECLMVGNDAIEDLAIRALGVKTYLVTDCLENKKNIEFETDYQGSLEQFFEWIRED